MQTSPPCEYINNYEVRGIQKRKDYFKVALASLDPKLSLQDRDMLMPQANITINLIRSFRVNPKLSAYAHIFRKFYFNVVISRN